MFYFKILSVNTLAYYSNVWGLFFKEINTFIQQGCIKLIQVPKNYISSK